MQQESIATIIENVGGVGISLLKDHIMHRQQKQQMQDKMDMQKELVKTRAEQMNKSQASAAGGSAGALQSQSASESSDPLGAAADVADQYSTLLEKARDSEDCGMCRMLIEAIMDKSLDVQRQALPELRSLKQQADNGASTEELKSFIKNTDVLKDVMKEETLRRGGASAQTADASGGGQARLGDATP